MSRRLLILAALAGVALAVWGLLGWPLDSLRGMIVQAAGCLMTVLAVQRLTAG